MSVLQGTGRETHVVRYLDLRGDGVTENGLQVPRTLPGEVVSGCVEGSVLTDVRVIEPSGDRVSPPCRHFKSCGACQLQHASDAFVCSWKQDVVEHALSRQGMGTDLRPVQTSAPQSRRRATFAARRTKKGATAGFHARASDVIVEIPDCKLLDPDLMRALSVAKALAGSGASRRGVLSVSVTLSEAGLDVAAAGGVQADGAMLAQLAHEASRFDLARLSWNGELVATRRPPVQRFGRALVEPPAGAFLQATKSGEATLLSAAQEATTGAARIVDLFAGCGTFALPLAERAEILAVEGNPDMVRALDAGWRRAPNLKKITTEARDLFRRPLLPDELARFDACVIDPPRAGAEAQTAELARSGIATIAYVSCNPVTFASDAKTLVDAGYVLDWLQIVDQFRWSSHIEVAARFSLTSA